MELLCMLGDDLDVVSSTSRVIPHGGIEHRPLLNLLLDAVKLQGQHKLYQNATVRSSHAAWFKEGASATSTPSAVVGGGKSLQTTVYKVFSSAEKTHDVSRELTKKLVTTFGEDFANKARVRADWYLRLLNVLEHCKTHLKMCVLKTIIGGWTTSNRMHEPNKLSCVFGCKEEPDDIKHYIVCAPLWQITGEILGAQPPISLAERLCIDDPCPQGVVRLALAFHCYHYAKSLCTGDFPQFHVQNTAALQKAAKDSGRTFLHHLN